MTQCHFASLVYDETGRNELEGGTIMKIKKRVLLQAMEYAKNAAATDAVNETLKKVLLNITAEQITIIGSDLKMSVTSNLKSGFQSDDKDLGKYLVDPGMFVQLLKELPSSVEDITLDFEKNITLKYNRSKVKLESFNGAENYPIPEEEKDVLKSVTVDGTKFAALIDAVGMLALDNKMPVLKAIHIVCENGKMRSEATDGHTMAISETEVKELEETEKFDFCVEGKCLRSARRMFKGNKITLKITNKFVFISSDQLRISIRKVEGKFPDLNKMLSKFAGIGALAISKDELSGVLKRCSLLKGNKRNPVLLSTEDNLLNVDMTTDKSNLHEELNVFKSGENLKIYLDSARLLECINIIPKEDDTLNLYYASMKNPIILKNEDYLYCVMPIRANA